MGIYRPTISNRRTLSPILREIPSSSLESLAAYSSNSSSPASPPDRISETPGTSPAIAKSSSVECQEDYATLLQDLLGVNELAEDVATIEEPGIRPTRSVCQPTAEERLAAVMTRSPSPVGQLLSLEKNEEVGTSSKPNETQHEVHPTEKRDQLSNGHLNESITGNPIVAGSSSMPLSKPTSFNRTRYVGLDIKRTIREYPRPVAGPSRVTPKPSSRRQATLWGHVKRTAPSLTATNSKALSTEEIASLMNGGESTIEAWASTFTAPGAADSAAISRVKRDAECQATGNVPLCQCGKSIQDSINDSCFMSVHILLDQHDPNTRDVGTLASTYYWQQRGHCEEKCLYSTLPFRKRKPTLIGPEPGIPRIERSQAPSPQHFSYHQPSFPQSSSSECSPSQSSSSGSRQRSEESIKQPSERRTTPISSPTSPPPAKKQCLAARMPGLYEGLCQVCGETFPFTAARSSFFCPGCEEEGIRRDVEMECRNSVENEGTVVAPVVGIVAAKQDHCNGVSSSSPLYLSDEGRSSVEKELNIKTNVQERTPEIETAAMKRTAAAQDGLKAAKVAQNSSASSSNSRNSSGSDDEELKKGEVVIHGYKDAPSTNPKQNDFEAVPRKLPTNSSTQTSGPTSARCLIQNCNNPVPRLLYFAHSLSASHLTKHPKNLKTRSVATQASPTGPALCDQCKASKLSAKRKRNSQRVIVELRKLQQQQQRKLPKKNWKRKERRRAAVVRRGCGEVD